MKYFTKDICCFDLQSKSPEKVRKAERKGKSNRQKYLENLERILPNLPKKYHRFFEQNCQLGDGCVHQILFSNIYLRTKSKNFVEIHVTHPENGKRYVLKYKNIRRCIFDHPSTTPMYYEENECGFGDWFSDELTMTKDEWFIHEILFDTGATLLIEFKIFHLEITKETVKTRYSE